MQSTKANRSLVLHRKRLESLSRYESGKSDDQAWDLIIRVGESQR